VNCTNLAQGLASEYLQPRALRGIPWKCILSHNEVVIELVLNSIRTCESWQQISSQIELVYSVSIVEAANW
jgi:hypothetical protein